MNENVEKVIKLSVVILVSALIGVLLGQLVSNYELRYMFSREYCGEYKNVEIYKTKNADEGIMSEHKEMLALAPDKLLEGCERIYFTGSDIEVPVFDEGLGDALGLTIGRTIYISTKNFGSYVLLHELFHAYDNANGDISENSPAFLRAYRANKRAIPVYASHSDDYPAEYFAQAGAMYLLIPQELSVAAPETYEYFSELFL